MLFETGRVLCWNFHLGGQLSIASPVRVVEHTERGLLLWLAEGTPVWRAVLPEGAHLRDLPPESRPAEGFPVAPDRWRPGNSLIFQPAGASQATWWLFDSDMTFQGWYVNLEYRTQRNLHLDVEDLELDIRVSPDRVARWKDEASFEAKIDQPGYWTAQEAETIRVEGRAAIRSAKTSEFPFDGSWCSFKARPVLVSPAIASQTHVGAAELGARHGGGHGMIRAAQECCSAPLAKR